MNNPTNWHEGLEVVLCTYGEEEQWKDRVLPLLYLCKSFLQARQNIWGLGISPLLFFTDTLTFSISGESGWIFPSNRLSLLDLKMFRRAYLGSSSSTQSYTSQVKS